MCQPDSLRKDVEMKVKKAAAKALRGRAGVLWLSLPQQSLDESTDRSFRGQKVRVSEVLRTPRLGLRHPQRLLAVCSFCTSITPKVNLFLHSPKVSTSVSIYIYVHVLQ